MQMDGVLRRQRGHPGSLQQQCSYELQHFSALRYASFAAEFGNGAADFSNVHPPPPQETGCRSAAMQRQERCKEIMDGANGTADIGTCTMLDEHVASAIQLTTQAQHPLCYAPLRCITRLRAQASNFAPGKARITRASRRRNRRDRRKCAAHKACGQTLDMLTSHARQLAECSAEQTAALDRPVGFSADQLVALNLPVLARKCGGAHMRRLALRERKRAVAPLLQAASRRWLARRILARLQADHQQCVRLRELQVAHDAATQRVQEMLRTTGQCPTYPSTGSLSEWAQSMWAWLHRAGLGAAVAESSLSSQLSSLSHEVQVVCRSLSSELHGALGHFSAGVTKVVEDEFGHGNTQHGGRILQVVLGGISISVPDALKHKPRAVRAQWCGGRGKGRQVPRQERQHDK